MSIQKARKLGKYRPHAESEHADRAKMIHQGHDSDTGATVRFYERDGERIRISAEEWPKWRKVRSY